MFVCLLKKINIYLCKSQMNNYCETMATNNCRQQQSDKFLVQRTLLTMNNDGTVTSTAPAVAVVAEMATITTTTTTTTTTTIMKTFTTGFYKFLARFSGRRRHYHLKFKTLVTYATLFLLLSLLSITDACSSRTTPKPRPPTPTPRPNITFHTYKCPPSYAAWYCLNEATCFTVKIGDSLLYNCECADGYMGPRCEYKDLDGSYLPTRPRVMLETASIASGATLALFLVLILCLVLYVRWHQQQKKIRLTHEENGNGIDTVDGLHTVRSVQPELRPFGPHHQKIIPMAEALKS